jgi:serine O-acetyltransferase
MLQAPEISATIPDWSRERPRRWFDPSRRLLRHIRGYQAARKRRGFLHMVRTNWHVVWYRIWSLAAGAEIDLNAQIGGGLLLPHPNGIVIHPEVVIGPNCLIFQQVTLGTGGPLPGSPKLGGHVDVGAGARVLGGVTIGDHARIGANAVVLQDVPDHATAVGVPARMIEHRNAEPAGATRREAAPAGTGPQPAVPQRTGAQRTGPQPTGPVQ